MPRVVFCDEENEKQKSARFDASFRSTDIHLHQVPLAKLDSPDELLSVHEVGRSSCEKDTTISSGRRRTRRMSVC